MAIDLGSYGKKRIIIVILALVAGVVAVLLMNRHINQTVKEEKRKVESAATKEIKKLEQKISQMDQAYSQAIQNINDQQQAQMQQLMQQQQAAQPRGVEQPKPQPSLSANTPQGKRAVTIMIESILAVGGLVRPGDTVDVLGQLQLPKEDGVVGAKEETTVTLFQNIRVLAVGTNISPQGGGPPQQTGQIPVTLALNPQEVNLLSFARQKGNLQLALRSPGESDAYLLPAATIESLSEYIRTTQGLDSTKEEKIADVKPAEKPKKEPQIEIFRGGRK